jgi:hypothetical protein
MQRLLGETHPVCGKYLRYCAAVLTRRHSEDLPKHPRKLSVTEKPVARASGHATRFSFFLLQPNQTCGWLITKGHPSSKRGSYMWFLLAGQPFKECWGQDTHSQLCLSGRINGWNDSSGSTLIAPGSLAYGTSRPSRPGRSALDPDASVMMWWCVGFLVFHPVLRYGVRISMFCHPRPMLENNRRENPRTYTSVAILLIARSASIINCSP